MYKILFVLVSLLFYFQKYDYIDLSQFESKEIKVEIKGEVNKPDVYTLPYKSTIEDLIEEADGFSSKADTSQINLTRILQNNDVIVIPDYNDKKTLVSINSASLEELVEIPGIGEAMAQRIIDYRKEKSFNSLEDIMNVKGIKEKMFSKIKNYITL